MTITVYGTQPDNYVEIENLLVLLLHDEPTLSGRMALRLTGWHASRDPHGVRWGGRNNCRLHKDLAQLPRKQGRGEGLSSKSTKLLQTALRMEKTIGRSVYVQRPQLAQRPKFPSLWAAFRPKDATAIRPSGPEFEAMLRRMPWPRDRVAAYFRRRYQGLEMLPLEWVTDDLRAAVAILAEMHSSPTIQSFRVDEFPADLSGYFGASHWDFGSTR